MARIAAGLVLLWLPGAAIAAEKSAPHPMPPVRPDAYAPTPPVTAPSADDPIAPLANVQVDPEMAALRVVIEAYRKGDIAAGDRARLALNDPDARSLAEWLAIRYGGSAVNFERILAFQRANPGWPGATYLRRRAEHALLVSQPNPDAIRSFYAVQRPVSPYGKLALATALRADGLNDDAAALVREAWRNDGFGADLEDRLLSAFPDAIGPADHRRRMETQLFKEKWDIALRAAERVSKDAVALAKLRMAVVRKQSTAQKLLDAVPAALQKDPSYLFSRVQFLRRAEKPEKTAEAVQVLSELTRDPDQLVDGDDWWVERRIIARRLLDAGDPKGAYEVVRRHAAEAPENRIEAEFQAGWIALRFLNQPREAAVHFANAATLAEMPVSVSRAAYWRGRAAEAVNDQAAAVEFYTQAANHPLAYYGQLAAAKLGRETLPVNQDALASDVRLPASRAIRLLYRAGSGDLALPLMVGLGHNLADPAELEAVGALAAKNGDTRSLLVLGKAAIQRGLPLDVHAFPVQGVPSFEPVANQVEQAMVFAIARQESLFDPTARSPVGARGLMQLMPATAKQTAEHLGVAYDVDRLLDATYNARLGAAHLTELVENWRGSYILTIASYNAGGGNVRKWVEAYGDPRQPGVDPVDWVERIPFSETRNYVQRVMENLQVYRRRFDRRSSLLIEADLKRGNPVR